MKNKRKFLIKWLCVCAIVSALICAGFFVWLRMALPSLTFLNSHIEDSLKKLAPDYRIEFGEIKVAASIRHLIPGVQVRDIRVYCGETVMVVCPELFASFSLSGLITGQMHPVRIHIRDVQFPPLFPAPSSAETSGSASGREKAVRLFTGALSRLSSLLQEYNSFKELDIEDAVIAPENLWDSPLLEIPELRVKISHKKSETVLKMNMRTQFQEIWTEFTVQTVWSSADESVQMKTEFRNLYPFLPARFIPALDFLRDCRFPVQGRIQARIASGNMDLSLVEIRSSGGMLFHPRVWEKPLHMEKMDMRAAVGENFSRITLHSFFIAFAEPDFHGPVFSGSGNIRLGQQHPEIDMEIHASRLKPDRAHRYWPCSSAPAARSWIRHHFKSGDIEDAELKLRFQPQDWQKAVLPENVLTALVPFQHITLDYHPPLAPVHDVAGVAEFTFHGVDIQVSQGRVYDTLVEKGRVNIQWMKEEPDISIQAHTQGPPEDLRQAVDALTGRKSPSVSIAEGTARTRLTFDFPLKHFAKDKFLYTAESQIRDIRIPDFHGCAITLKNLSAELHNQEIAFEGSTGKVSSTKYLERPVSVKSIQGNGQILHDPPGMVLETLSANLKGPEIRASGFVKCKEEYPHIDANIQVHELPLQEAVACWPLNLAPSVRTWIKTRFSSGRIDGAAVRIDMEPQVFGQKHQPKTAVEAIVPFTDVTLDYHPPLPKLEKGEGIAIFHADSMDAELRSGIAGKSGIEKGMVSITDMTGKKPEMKIQAAVSGPVQDILNAAGALGSKYNGPEITGSEAKTQLEIALPLVSDLSAGEVRVKGSSEIKNIVIPNISGISLSQGNIFAQFDGGRVNARGSIFAGTTELSVDLQTALSHRQNASAVDVLRVTGVLHGDRLKDFGLPPLPFLTGSASCDTVLTVLPDHTRIDLTADIENTELDLKQVGWHKAKGHKGTVRIKADTSAKNITLSEIQLSGNDFAVSGSGTLRKGTGPLVSDLRFDTVRFGDSDFALQISTGTEHAIGVTGKRFDAAPLIRFFSKNHSKDKSDSEAKKEKKPFSCTVSADVEKLGLCNDVELRGLRLSGRWNNSRIVSAQMQGNHSEKENFSLSLSPLKTGTRINISSDNAGLVLKGFDISKNIIGGQWEFSADSQDGFPTKKAVAMKLNMRDFALINVSLVTKILSAASFVGILEQMKSGGVAFDTLEADMEYAGQVLTLRTTRMEGLSMGMTAEGFISLSNDTMELRGVVVPFNLVNKMVGMIPVLGKLIVGDGIIATNYTATGAYKDPDVRIEPLSTLAIGSLRRIFNRINLKKARDAEHNADVNMNPQENK